MLRAYRLADYPHLDPEIRYLYNAFKKVGFPKHVIDKVHSRVKRKFFRVNRQQDRGIPAEVEEDPKPTIAVPHNKFVQEYVRPVFSGNNFRVVHPATNSLRTQLVSNRPLRPASVESKQLPGVYRVPCIDCELSYYGETGRGIDVRINEHRGAMRRGDQKNACFKHFALTNHNIDFDNCHVIYQSPNWYNRLVVESSCIVNLPNFNNMRSTLAIDRMSANLILSSCKSVQV